MRCEFESHLRRQRDVLIFTIFQRPHDKRYENSVVPAKVDGGLAVLPCVRPINKNAQLHGMIAQLEERQVEALRVGGSIPSYPTIDGAVILTGKETVC